MTTEEKDQFYKAGYLAGKEHQAMSPETKGAISLFTKDMDYLKEEIREVKETLNKFIDKCDKCYVSKDRFKPVEMITYGLVGLIGGGFITALFYFLVYKK